MRRAISIEMNQALASRKRASISPIPVETALADAERAKLNEDVCQQQGEEESTLSAGEQAAATPGRTFLYTIQRPEVHNGRTIPGYIQIDEFIDGENTRSTNIADLKKEGIEIPEPPASLPRGQYTLEQIRW